MPALSRRRPLARWLAAALLVALVAAVVFTVVAWKPAIEPLASAPAPASFDAGLVRRGAELAAVGNCIGCHTTLDGAPWAGGVALATPFGTIYGSNVTPDVETGIGGWSEQAFRRALREGVARDGAHLYPAFPYDHYTQLADADIGALYAFLMTRVPVRSTPPPNRLDFPLGFRPLVAGWKLLFLRGGTRPEHASDRGAYLVDALAHCGGCHSPRNALGAERHDASAFSGGMAEAWYAPALDRSSPSPLPWTREALVSYLTSGLADGHAIAGGPMQQVVAQLGQAPRADVEAIAAKTLALMGEPDASRQARADASRSRAGAIVERAAAGVAEGARDGAAPTASAAEGTPPASAAAAAPTSSAAASATTTAGPADASTRTPGTAANAADASIAAGAQVYADACGSCHDAGRAYGSAGALPLPLAVALYEPTPTSLLRIVRDGIGPLDGTGGRFMPSFGQAIADADLAALLAYLRRAQADAPAWPDLARHVEASRR